MAWQVQEAKQRLSELVQRAGTEGPQIVTKHGRPIAVVLDFERYRSLVDDGDDFKAFLRSVPAFEPPRRDVARQVEL